MEIKAKHPSSIITLLSIFGNFLAAVFLILTIILWLYLGGVVWYKNKDFWAHVVFILVHVLIGFLGLYLLSKYTAYSGFDLTSILILITIAANFVATAYFIWNFVRLNSIHDIKWNEWKGWSNFAVSGAHLVVGIVGLIAFYQWI